jgi:hypothetical protein
VCPRAWFPGPQLTMPADTTNSPAPACLAAAWSISRQQERCRPWYAKTWPIRRLLTHGLQYLMVFYQFLEDPFTSTSNARWATMGYVARRRRRPLCKTDTPNRMAVKLAHSVSQVRQQA